MKTRRVFKILALVLFVFLLFSGGYFMYQLYPKDRNSSDVVSVQIKEGMTRTDIAKLLYDDGLIRNSTVFALYTKFTHVKILAGIYEISASSSASDIASIINSGKIKTSKITIPEGWRATDIEDYLVNTKHLSQFKGFATTAAQYEGYLFPDTYEIPIDASTDNLIKLMRDNFDTRTKGLAITPDVIKLASIVEREANTDADRPIIASVYLNRLKADMLLQADPTVQYAKGNWKSVTLSEYTSVISPYNTYLNKGLPPTPICNPGLKSIQAVLSPASTNYLYFFHANGTSYFSTTLQEHQAKIKKYF